MLARNDIYHVLKFGFPRWKTDLWDFLEATRWIIHTPSACSIFQNGVNASSFRVTVVEFSKIKNGSTAATNYGPVKCPSWTSSTIIALIFPVFFLSRFQHPRDSIYAMSKVDDGHVRTVRRLSPGELYGREERKRRGKTAGAHSTLILSPSADATAARASIRLFSANQDLRHKRKQKWRANLNAISRVDLVVARNSRFQKARGKFNYQIIKDAARGKDDVARGTKMVGPGTINVSPSRYCNCQGNGFPCHHRVRKGTGHLLWDFRKSFVAE